MSAVRCAFTKATISSSTGTGVGFGYICGECHINYAPQGLWAQTQNMWFAALMDNETFFNMYKRVGMNRSPQRFELLDSIVLIFGIQYGLRNFERWDIMGSCMAQSREVVALATYREQVEYLYNYLLKSSWLTHYTILSIDLIPSLIIMPYFIGGIIVHIFLANNEAI